MIKRLVVEGEGEEAEGPQAGDVVGGWEPNGQGVGVQVVDEPGPVDLPPALLRPLVARVDGDGRKDVAAVDCGDDPTVR